MTQPDHPKLTPDEELADFADRVLDGKSPLPDSAVDAEMRGLEETILRLKQTLPPQALDERAIRRMQANFKARVRKADSPTIPVWPIMRPRPRLALAFAALALAVLVLAAPFLTLPEPVEGTAGIQPQELLLVVGALSVIALLIWARRRK